ncbi:MAG: HD domain-containing protein [Eubacteriales bacterium]|jgi:uncharacterized protein|nr:HD domain-containing protein [Clostridiales bacterium]
MKAIYTNKQLMQMLCQYARDILDSEGMKLQAGFVQHGAVSTYQHSVSVALCSMRLALRLGLEVDMRSMVRGALLHDYFLYDWHDPDVCPRFHGYTHPKTALENAERDFKLNDIERDIIIKHMFPLTPVPPRYAESMLVTVADKLCAARETLAVKIPTKFKLKQNHNGLY